MIETKICIDRRECLTDSPQPTANFYNSKGAARSNTASVCKRCAIARAKRAAARREWHKQASEASGK